MAICEECYHFYVCKNATISNPEYKGKPEDKSKTCRGFVSCADIVEVVRCKDYKHGIKSLESLYNAFRLEIEKICTPEILKQLTTIKLIRDNIDVGILSFIKQDEWIYIDALYVMPEFRKNGVGRNAVLNWYDEYKDEEIRLHIVHKNEVAQNFWKSIFELEEIESNFLETLYRIKKLKRQ